MTPLLKHLSGEPIGRFPVWLMRQAGRYLPSYQKIRSQHSFWEMVTTPEIASEVSLLPLTEIAVDGIILFSDILSLPYGLSIPIEMKEKVGPVIRKPLVSVEDFAIFDGYNPVTHTSFVGKALGLIQKTLPSDKTLIGFCGAPWTVASYLIEGSGKTNFENILRWLHRDPKELHKALDKLTQATKKYIAYQGEQGAQVIQIFDTWVSEMPVSFFESFYLPLLNELFYELAKKKIPSIYFAKRGHHLMQQFKNLKADILSVDSLVSLTEIETLTEKKFSLQGNLDPFILFEDVGLVRQKTRLLVQEAQRLKRPAILNLGHGILPGTPVENAKAFVEEAKALWI